jgi:hypothetical protein
MKNIITTLCLVSSLLNVGCGEKEEKKVCGTKVQSTYEDDILKATVNEGCVIKYASPNTYKIDGDANFIIAGDTMAKKTIEFVKGKLISTHGKFIVDTDGGKVQIRLLEGNGKIVSSDKEYELKLLQVAQLGK